MSRRDYVKAYALLEQSLGEQPFFEPRKDLPQQWHVATTYHEGVPEIFAMVKNVKSNKFIDNLQDIELSSQILTPSRAPTGYETVLPPTPPSNTNLTKSSADMTYGLTSSEHYPLRSSTPTYPRRSLPTPDSTPPSWTSHVTSNPSSTPHVSSPDADSFKTAREEQWSVNGNNSRSHLSLANNMESSRTKMWLDSGRLTGLEAVLKHRRAVSDLSRLPDTPYEGMDEVDDVVDEEWMKNVTSWSKRPGATTKTPPLMQGLNFRNDGGARHGSEYSPTELSFKEWEWSSTMNGTSSDVRERTHKRWSGTSVSSTVIEAFIVDTPPQRKRKLRHVSKNLAVRDEASRSDYSNRNSIISDDVPVHHLHHMKKQIPNRSHRDSTGSDMSTSTFSHPLRRRRDSIPSRPLPSHETSNNYNYDYESHLSLNRSNTQVVTGKKDYEQRVVYDGSLLKSLVPMFPPQNTERMVPPISTVVEENHVRYTNILENASHVVYQPDLDIHNPSTLIRTGSDQSHVDLGSIPRMTFGHVDGQSPLRHLYVRTSPLFAGSEGSEVHLSEAMAVRIHPQRPTLMFPKSTQSSAFESLDMFEPSTPIMAQKFIAAVDSPPENAHTPPEPPIVAVIPPTPSQDAERDASPASMRKSPLPKPTRRSSLLRHVRQYSDSVIQPIVTFTVGNTGSLKRRNSNRRRSYEGDQQKPLKRRAGPGLSKQNGSLHPFWQPRGFWDDLSDTEDEGEHDDEALDQLPAGGDTSDVVDPEPRFGGTSKWRRSGSLRGFLIGNSLGLERGPTNKRRHVVSLPSSKRSRNNADLIGFQKYSELGTHENISVRQSARRSGEGKRSRSRLGLFDGLKAKLYEIAGKREAGRRQEERGRISSQYRAEVQRRAGWEREWVGAKKGF